MDYETPEFFKMMKYAERADRDVVDMVSGNPDWGSPEALHEALHEYADMGGAEFQYSPSEGLPELRAEVADRKGVDPTQVVITNGTCEANYLGMACALDRTEADEVLLTDPVYPYYTGKSQMLGGTYRTIPAQVDGQVDPGAIREAASEDTACIVVNTPNNPTGAVYPAETMHELVAIAEEYDAVLVSDETYDQFDYSGQFESALAVDSAHRVVTNSFSKSLAITGFRVGYAVLPDELVGAAKTRHMLTNIAASRPAQYAVLQALRNAPDDYYRESRELLEGRIETFTSALDAVGASYTNPEGAFYVLVRFEGFSGSLENVQQLVDEAGVAGMHGEAFGESFDDWIRFALVSPRVEEAANRLVEYFG